MILSTYRFAAVPLLLLAFVIERGIAQTPPRRPRGIYAVVNITENINQQRKANPSVTPAQLVTYFSNLYSDLLTNPAIAGLVLQAHWDTLNPNPPSSANAYDWSYVDAAFSSAATWNGQNPARAPKTVQLIVTPGFQSPPWLLDQIPSCDGLFQSPAQIPASCGKVTITGYVEGGDGTQLPLPWNPVYKAAWKTFLTALAGRYTSNPTFVSIAVAGPTASSAEMILPNPGNTPAQSQFGGISVEDVWLRLLAFQYPNQQAYQKSDQAFIDEWNAAIDLYGQLFSGLTLVATTGNGLINFSNSGFTIPSAFSFDCMKAPDMDCAAETTILSHFVDPSVGGANAKATQESGMEASRGINTENLGIAGVKQLALNTASFTSPSSQILAGSQFNTSFANSTLEEGCTSTFPPNANDKPAACSIPSTCTTQACLPVTCIPQACLAPGVTQADLSSYKQFSEVPAKYLIPPEQAEYNVLHVYFNGTRSAPSFGGTQGMAPLNYLQIYSPDIQYATTHANAPANVVQTSGATVSVSAQDLLNLAGQKLLEIAEPPLPQPQINNGGIVNNASYSASAVAPGEIAAIFGTNLTDGTSCLPPDCNPTFAGDGKLNTVMAGAQVTVNSIPVPIFYATPVQLGVQIPFEATGNSASIVVSVNGRMSASGTLNLTAVSPGIFTATADGKGTGAITHVNGTPVNAQNPAHPNELVIFYATGLGQVAPAVATGALPGEISNTVAAVTLSIGGVTVIPDFAGLAGCCVGLNQINARIPAGVIPGNAVPVVLNIGGKSSNMATIAVQ